MMLTNIFRLEGMDEIRWFKFGYRGHWVVEDRAKDEGGGSFACSVPKSQGGASSLPSCSSPAAEVIVRAHLLLQRDGHLSSWRLVGMELPRRQHRKAERGDDGREGYLYPGYDTGISTPLQPAQAQFQSQMQQYPSGNSLFLWLFVHRGSACTNLRCPSIASAISELSLVEEGMWRASECSDEVAVALYQALQNRIERALVGLSYVRFGDLFVRCKPSMGGLDFPLSMPLPGCELRFSVSESGIFVQVRVCKRRVRLLSPSDLNAASTDTRLDSSKKAQKERTRVEVFVSPYGSRGFLSGTVCEELVEELVKRQLLPATDLQIRRKMVPSALFPLTEPPSGTASGLLTSSVYVEVEIGHVWRGGSSQRDDADRHTTSTKGTELGALGHRKAAENTVTAAAATPSTIGSDGKKVVEPVVGTLTDLSYRGGLDVTVDSKSAVENGTTEKRSSTGMSRPASTVLGGAKGREGCETEGDRGIENKRLNLGNLPSSLIYPIQGVLLPVWPAAPTQTYIRRCWLQGWTGRRCLESVVDLAGVPGWGDLGSLRQRDCDVEGEEEEQVVEADLTAAWEAKRQGEPDAAAGGAGVVASVEDSRSSSSCSGGGGGSSSSSSSSGRSSSSNSEVSSGSGENGSESEEAGNRDCTDAMDGRGIHVVKVCNADGKENTFEHLHMQAEDGDERVLDLGFVDGREEGGVAESIGMGVDEVLDSFPWDDEINGAMSDDQVDLLGLTKRKVDDIDDDFLTGFDSPAKVPRTEGSHAVHDDRSFLSCSVGNEVRGSMGWNIPDPGGMGMGMGMGMEMEMSMEGAGESAREGPGCWSSSGTTLADMLNLESSTDFLLFEDNDLGPPPGAADMDIGFSIPDDSDPLLRQPLVDFSVYPKTEESIGPEIGSSGDGQKGSNGDIENGVVASTTPDSGTPLADQHMVAAIGDPKMWEASMLCAPSYRAIRISHGIAAGIAGTGWISGSDLRCRYTPSRAVKMWIDGCALRSGYIYSSMVPSSVDCRGKRKGARNLGRGYCLAVRKGEKVWLPKGAPAAHSPGNWRVTKECYTEVNTLGFMSPGQQDRVELGAKPGKKRTGKERGSGISSPLQEGSSFRLRDRKSLPKESMVGRSALNEEERRAHTSCRRDGSVKAMGNRTVNYRKDWATKWATTATELESNLLFVRVCESAQTLHIRDRGRPGSVERGADAYPGRDANFGVLGRRVDPSMQSDKRDPKEEIVVDRENAGCNNSEEEFLRSMRGGPSSVGAKVEIGKWRDLGPPSGGEPMVTAGGVVLARQAQDGLRTRCDGLSNLGLGIGSNASAGLRGSGINSRDANAMRTQGSGVLMGPSRVEVASVEGRQSGVGDSNVSCNQRVGVKRELMAGTQISSGSAGAGRIESAFGRGGGGSNAMQIADVDAVSGSGARAVEMEVSCWGEMVDAIPLLAQQALVISDAGGLDGEAGDGPLPQLAVRSCIDRKCSVAAGFSSTSHSGAFVAVDELGDGGDDVMPYILEPLGAEVTPSTVASLLLSDFSQAFNEAFWEGIAQGPLSLSDWSRGRPLNETSIGAGDDLSGRSMPRTGSADGLYSSRGVSCAPNIISGSVSEPITPPQLGSSSVSSPVGSCVTGAASMSSPGAVSHGGAMRPRGTSASGRAKASSGFQHAHPREPQQPQQSRNQSREQLAVANMCPHQRLPSQRERRSVAVLCATRGSDGVGSRGPEDDKTSPWQWKEAYPDKRKAGEVGEGEVIVLPTPAMLIGYQEDWLKTSPSTLRLWEKAPLEPYAPPKPVTYYVLCQALDPLLEATGEFFHELSTVYETCKLGTHLPAAVPPGNNMQKMGLMCPPGVVAVPVRQSREMDHSTLGSSICPSAADGFGAVTIMKDFCKEEYREALKKVCQQLQLSTSPATSKRDHEHDPCVVVYVVCPSTEPDVILDTTIDVCHHLANVQWQDSSSLPGPSMPTNAPNMGRSSPSILSEPCANGARSAELPIASSAGVSYARVTVQVITLEIVMRSGTPAAGAMEAMKEVAFSVYSKARRTPRKLPAKYHGVSPFFWRKVQLQNKETQSMTGAASKNAALLSPEFQMIRQQQPGQQQQQQQHLLNQLGVKQHLFGPASTALHGGIHSSGQITSPAASVMPGGATSVWKDCSSRSGLTEDRLGMNGGEASVDQTRDWAGDSDWKNVVAARRLGIVEERRVVYNALDRASLPVQADWKGKIRLLYEPLFILAEPGAALLGGSKIEPPPGWSSPGLGRDVRGDLDIGDVFGGVEGLGEGGCSSGATDGVSGGGLGRELGGVPVGSSTPSPTLHCCYKWTESGRWLLSVWTDVRGELLDVLVLPVEAGLVGMMEDGGGRNSKGKSDWCSSQIRSGGDGLESGSMDDPPDKANPQLCTLFRLLLEQGLELMAMADEAGVKQARGVVIAKIGYMTVEEKQGWDATISALGGDEGWPLEHVVMPAAEASVESSAEPNVNYMGGASLGGQYDKGRRGGAMSEGLISPALDQALGMGVGRTSTTSSSPLISAGSNFGNRTIGGLGWASNSDHAGPGPLSGSGSGSALSGAVSGVGLSVIPSAFSSVLSNHMQTGGIGTGSSAAGLGGKTAMVGSALLHGQERSRLRWVQFISVVSFCVERSMQVVWASDGGWGTAANSPSAAQLQSTGSSSAGGHAMAASGIAPLKSLSHGAYLVVPSHTPHFLTPQALAASSVPKLACGGGGGGGSLKQMGGNKARSTAVPAASAFVISSINPAPLSNPLVKSTREEWPLNLRVSLMSHHVPQEDPSAFDFAGGSGSFRGGQAGSSGRSMRSWAGGSLHAAGGIGVGSASAGGQLLMSGGSMTGAGINGPGKSKIGGSTMGSMGSGGGGGGGGGVQGSAERDATAAAVAAAKAKVEARRLVEVIAAEMYALSWLTVSPTYPNRRSALPMHGAIAQRLGRILTYMDEEYRPVSIQS